MPVRHLVRRFLGMLVPGGPSLEGEAFAVAVLSEAELALWRRMSGPDRRHAVGVAKRVEAALGAQATPPVLAAALLHDVGKVE
ncbi:MAG: phosphohydrolase, partial [Actinomycetota bacterium]|nr:phosphohydrolase [Actinomycetota bacterium]